jgi:hypothetical protein
MTSTICHASVNIIHQRVRMSFKLENTDNWKMETAKKLNGAVIFKVLSINNHTNTSVLLLSFSYLIDSLSQACGSDSNCVNRMLYVECRESDCPCGEFCQNQR